MTIKFYNIFFKLPEYIKDKSKKCAGHSLDYSQSVKRKQQIFQLAPHNDIDTNGSVQSHRQLQISSIQTENNL